MVVVVEPAIKSAKAFGLRAVGPDVGPLVGQGAVESFDFSVGLRAVGADAGVHDAELGAQRGPGVALVARPAVGEKPLDGDATVGEVPVRSGQEGGALL